MDVTMSIDDYEMVLNAMLSGEPMTWGDSLWLPMSVDPTWVGLLPDEPETMIVKLRCVGPA